MELTIYKTGKLICVNGGKLRPLSCAKSIGLEIGELSVHLKITLVQTFEPQCEEWMFMSGSVEWNTIQTFAIITKDAVTFDAPSKLTNKSTSK